MNVAIGLARLGNRTAFFGRMSRDPLGTVLCRIWSGPGSRPTTPSGRPSRAPSRWSSCPTGRPGMSSRSRGPRISSGRRRRSRCCPAGAPVVHFGSLTSWQPPGDEVVNQRIAELRAAGSALISYDPNARPTLQGDAAAARAKVARSSPLAHVIKASSDDIEYLYGGQELGVGGRGLARPGRRAGGDHLRVGRGDGVGSGAGAGETTGVPDPGGRYRGGGGRVHERAARRARPTRSGHAGGGRRGGRPVAAWPGFWTRRGQGPRLPAAGPAPTRPPGPRSTRSWPRVHPDGNPRAKPVITKDSNRTYSILVLRQERIFGFRRKSRDGDCACFGRRGVPLPPDRPGWH